MLRALFDSCHSQSNFLGLHTLAQIFSWLCISVFISYKGYYLAFWLDQWFFIISCQFSLWWTHRILFKTPRQFCKNKLRLWDGKKCSKTRLWDLWNLSKILWDPYFLDRPFTTPTLGHRYPYLKCIWGEIWFFPFKKVDILKPQFQLFNVIGIKVGNFIKPESHLILLSKMIFESHGQNTT